MIGCVEQEGEDENKTTIPAKTDTLEPKSLKMTIKLSLLFKISKQNNKNKPTN